MTDTAATGPQPFTVIGFWDDSDTAIPVGVVKGAVDVYGGHGVSEGGPWARDVLAVHADEAEALAVKLTQEEHDARIAEMDEEDDDDDEEEDGDEDGEETGKVFEFDHNGRTYDVDFGGETYALYDDDNKHVAFFDYYGDRENHLSIEEAAIKALEAIDLETHQLAGAQRPGQHHHRRASASTMGDPLTVTPASEASTSAQKAPVTLGQAAWALMFVAIYVAVATGAILALGLTRIIEFTIETLLPVLFTSIAAAAFLALYFHLFRRNRLTPTDLGFRRPTRRLCHLFWQIPLAIIASATLQGLSLALLPLLGFDVSPADAADSSVADIGRLPASLAVVAILVVAVFTPLWEEILFRGAFLDGLSRRFRPAAAIILSAAIFAAIHIVPLSFAYLFTLGVALALLRRFHQNLWAPVLLHAVNNALVVLIAFIAIQPGI